MSAAVAGGSPEARRRRSRGYHPERSAASPDEDPAVRVKVESDADIKDYAETTMNELLGWYGYDKLDTRGLNLKQLHLPTSSSSTSSPARHDEDFSDEDTSQSPHFEQHGDSAAQTPNGATIICAWCLKTGLKLFTLKTSSGKTKAFCSEPCFNQCRRAAFKKNRICNWCRHVRHTVNYVDFKDGDDQLQFCSDKCLNQYKMQIFCKETQAYLQMNPHLQEESNKQTGTASSKLITPDLWLRDCQEPMNGGTAVNLSHSEDEQTSSVPAASKPCDDECVEDLTISSSKPESCSPHGGIAPAQEKDKSNDSHKALLDNSPILKRKLPFEMCNTLASYLRDDRDKSTLDRKKRYYENDRDHFRNKRQKNPSMRSRSNHHPPEAPPAHLSSTHSPLTMPNRLLQHSGSPYPSSLSTNSNSSLIPPAAHSKALPPHPSLTGSLVPQGLPPPLLNNDFLHHTPLSSSFFTPFSQQQHMDAVLRMQSGMRPGEHFPPPHMFQESMLPFTRTPHSAPFMQPNTVMLPYPVFVPLPVPIPIPIPLTGFLSKDKKPMDDQKSYNGDPASSENGDILNVDSDSDSANKTNYNFKSDTRDLPSVNTLKKGNQTPVVDVSTYAVKNNDSHTNRLILTRNKTRN